MLIKLSYFQPIIHQNFCDGHSMKSSNYRSRSGKQELKIRREIMMEDNDLKSSTVPHYLKDR